jgi:hypothetical protein
MALSMINNDINTDINTDIMDNNINYQEYEYCDPFYKTSKKEYCHLFFCEKHNNGCAIIGESLSSQFNFDLFPNFKEIVCCESNMTHAGYVSFDNNNKSYDQTFSDAYFNQFNWLKEDFLLNIYDKNGIAIEPNFELIQILAKDMINNYHYKSNETYSDDYDNYESQEDYLGCSDYFDENTSNNSDLKMIPKPKQSSLQSSLRSIDRYDLLQDKTLYYNIFYDDKFDQGFIIVSPNELTDFDTTTYPGLKKITKNDFYIDYNGCIVKENNKFVVKFMHTQDYYDRSCGGWELEYFLSSIYDTDGNKIDDVPKELEAIFTN